VLDEMNEVIPMLKKLIACLGCASVVGLMASPAFPQGDPQGQRPDFTGVWRNYRGPAGPGGIGDGELPFRVAARQKIDEYRALVEPIGDTPGAHCVGYGMPDSMLRSGGYPMEVIQRPDQLTVIYEAHSEIRRIYFGERIIPERDRFPERNGYSTGRWEGDTLVVETTQLKEQVDQRYAHSEEARIVERYRLSKDEAGTEVITAEMTLTDPVFYTGPVSATKRWERVPNGFLMTYECNEPAWSDHLEKLREAGHAR
jgi:hypothetical protein